MKERGLNSPEDDISSLGVCRNGGRDSGKPIRVDNGFLATGKLGKTFFQL